MLIVHVELEPLREKECDNNIGLYHLLGDPDLFGIGRGFSIFLSSDVERFDESYLNDFQ
jgi:hypothetical protein